MSKPIHRFERVAGHVRDLPDPELHLLPDAGHLLLETHFDEALPLARDFLSKTLR